MRPSKAQRRLMERMAEGAVIRPYGGRMELSAGDHDMGGIVPQRTIDALRRKGWLSSIQLPGLRPTLSITDLGRVALSSSGPAARAAQGEG